MSAVEPEPVALEETTVPWEPMPAPEALVPTATLKPRRVEMKRMPSAPAAADLSLTAEMDCRVGSLDCSRAWLMAAMASSTVPALRAVASLRRRMARECSAPAALVSVSESSAVSAFVDRVPGRQRAGRGLGAGRAGAGGGG
jgi:hypothetical protein